MKPSCNNCYHQHICSPYRLVDNTLRATFGILDQLRHSEGFWESIAECCSKYCSGVKTKNTCLGCSNCKVDPVHNPDSEDLLYNTCCLENFNNIAFKEKIECMPLIPDWCPLMGGEDD